MTVTEQVLAGYDRDSLAHRVVAGRLVIVN